MERRDRRIQRGSPYICTVVKTRVPSGMHVLVCLFINHTHHIGRLAPRALPHPVHARNAKKVEGPRQQAGHIAPELVPGDLNAAATHAIEEEADTIPR